MKLYRLDGVEGEHFSVRINVRNERTDQEVDVHFMPVAFVAWDCLEVFHGVRIIAASRLTNLPFDVTPRVPMNEVETSLVSALGLEYAMDGIWRSRTSPRSTASVLNRYIHAVESYQLYKKLWDPEEAVLRLVRAHLRLTHLLMNAVPILHGFNRMSSVNAVLGRVDGEMRHHHADVQVEGGTFLSTYPIEVTESWSVVGGMVSVLAAVDHVDTTMLGDV